MEMGCLRGRVVWLESGLMAQPTGRRGFWGGQLVLPCLEAPQETGPQSHLSGEPWVPRPVTALDKPGMVEGQSHHVCHCLWEP